MASKDPKKPNILFVLTDDQGPWAMGCAGNPEIKTPNLDRLAATGVRFSEFFCTSPVCSAARASIVTGTIPSSHGVHDWLRGGNCPDDFEDGGEPIEYLAGKAGYTDVLADNGYRCGLSGKWHIGATNIVQKSHEFWDVHARGGGPYYAAGMLKSGEPYMADGYVTDVITDNALGFLGQQASDDTPFYLGVHYTAPHSPWGRKEHPLEVWDDYYNNCPFESTPNGLPVADWVVALGHDVRDDEVRRIFLSGYYAAVTCMDANVGRLIDWLEEQGLRENTLICFTSDNGMNMGHHGVYGKGNATYPQNMYEESVKVPTIVSQPGRVPEGIVRTEMASHYDWFPTFLDYVGIDNPHAEKLPGQSFARVLEGGDSDGSEVVVVYEEYGPLRMIRTKDWKYIHRYLDGPPELFNLTEDPGEERNLVEMPEFQDKVMEMRRQMDEWFERYVDPSIDGSKLPVKGRGQLLMADQENAFYPEIWETRLK